MSPPPPSGPAPRSGSPSAPPRPSWPPRPARPPERHTGPWLRPTIRIRLTLLYGGMFLMAGIVLLAILYLIAAHALDAGTAVPFRFASQAEVEITSDICPGIVEPVDVETFSRWYAQCAEIQRDLALDQLLSRALLALLGLAVAAFAFGYVMAGRVLSPLGRITRTARRVAGSNLHRRIELDGPDDELKELADTFDEMLDRIDRAFTAQQRFVANASHELRTPLAINRTLLEVQLADPEASTEVVRLGRTLLATNERSEQLVEGLLLLARSENELVDRKPVDLAEVAGRALEQVRDEAREAGVAVHGECAPAVVRGNGVLLERVALNLVQNAVRHNTTADGWAEVRTTLHAGRAELTVTNSGPVVPDWEVESMFEPFRRLRSERTGSHRGAGIGLSIVRSVARAHGGSVTAEPRDGGGLTMRVFLPV